MLSIRRQERWIDALPWLVLCLGLTVAAFIATRWTTSTAEIQNEAFTSSAEAVRAVVSSELRLDESLVASLRGDLAAHPDLTNAELLRWYESSGTAERFRDGVDFGYIQRVPAAELAAFVAQVAADPVTGLVAPKEFNLFPDSAKAEYCLQRVGIWSRTDINGLEIPAGLNFCAAELEDQRLSEFPTLLAAATDTGRVQVLTPDQFVDGSFVIVAPIYNATPADSQTARRAASIGWVASSFDAATLIDAALRDTSHLSVTVRHVGPDGSTRLIAEGGASSIETSLTLPVLGDSGWSVVVGATSAVLGHSPFVQGLGVFFFGAMLSLLTFVLARALVKARCRALTAATDRTAEIDYSSLHDDLTGLPNRTLILDRITQMQARALRPSSVVAALSIEIDGYASVCDTLGHVAGENLINAVATRITSALRETDTVGRLGENGFVVLVQGELPLARPALAAQRIVDVLAEPVTLGASPVPISASIGIATGTKCSPVDLLRNADIAMYRAKVAGQGSYVIFDTEIGAAMDRRILIEHDLRSALERDQLVIQYQPTFNLQSGAMTGAEALVRWNHPTLGLVPPDDFIPFAEESRRIVPIGRWVLREACHQAADWNRDGHRIRVAVNMSTVQIEDDSFVADVKEALTDSGLPASQLVLELTETALLSDTTVVRFRLEALKGIGVGISIDDFGTGYTSITYLQQFPIDTIKIDKSFVDDIAWSPDAAALCRTLVQLGRSLGLETLAEGIETEAQLTELIRAGCESGQGYLYSRPLGADEVDEFLSRQPVGQPHS
ncbi:MAG: bifunctional diguanylate cyclase/phosphodiesterase [Microthrixaceae bacterium]